MNTAFIYSLNCPITNIPKYVGKTISPQLRLTYHIRDIKKSNNLRSNWIKSLINKGLKPTLEILDEIPESEWQYWEQYWINQLKVWGFNLKNGDNGGLGSHRFTDEIKKKISDTVKRNKINGMLGKKHSQETKNKISQKALGRKATIKTRLILSNIHKNRVHKSKIVNLINIETKNIIETFKTAELAQSNTGINTAWIKMYCLTQKPIKKYNYKNTFQYA